MASRRAARRAEWRGQPRAGCSVRLTAARMAESWARTSVAPWARRWAGATAAAMAVWMALRTACWWVGALARSLAVCSVALSVEYLAQKKAVRWELQTAARLDALKAVWRVRSSAAWTAVM
jgi:hypothetical protein